MSLLCFPLLTHQQKWLMSAALLIFVQLGLNSFAAQLKPVSELDWMDIVSEGGTALFILAWLYFVLSSRPGGRVTTLFALGLLFLFSGTFQDTLDEMLQMDSSQLPHGLIESVTLPAGMILLTLGMYYWQQEQRIVSGQLKKREQLFREHRNVDGVTQIHRLAYLKKHLALLIRQQQIKQQELSVMLLDLCDFGDINSRFGAGEGDRVLHAVSELLILNLRGDDLLCRYAGNRFAVLLPDTDERQARQLAEELLAAVAAFAFRSRSGERHKLHALAAIACSSSVPMESLLEQVSGAMELAKQSRTTLVCAGSSDTIRRLA